MVQHTPWLFAGLLLRRNSPRAAHQDSQMSRQDANAALALSSFLYGGNAAYIEGLYARYQTDPNAVDAQWQAFFKSLKEDTGEVARSATGPSWKHPNWPSLPRGELVSAFDASWSDVEQRVGARIMRNSTRAPMRSRKRITTGPSSSTTCWGWTLRRCARSWRFASAPIVRR